jgi:hypothetical protein
VWRLAVATLSFDDVLEGPTTAATLQHRGIVVKTSESSVDLCDDGLSQLELDIICGLHHCQTGMYVFFCLSHPSSDNYIHTSGKSLRFKVVVANRQHLAKKRSTHMLDRNSQPFFYNSA